MESQQLIRPEKKNLAPKRGAAGGSADSGNFSRKLSDKDFDLFRKLVYANSGISLGDDRKDLLTNRLAKRIRTGGFGSYRDYYDFVVNDKSGQELIQLLNMISTNLTYFFRETKHYSLLQESVLPQLIAAKKRLHNRRIRFWSAACSTGEEVYSLLITVLPFLDPISAWDFKLLGSDISTKVLATAKEGRYARNQIKGFDPKRIPEYFLEEDHSLVVKPDLKRLTKFARLNLLEPFPFKGKFEVIFCRNVMIYFDNSTKEQLINKFHKILTPGGYLFIGHSENLTGLRHNFSYIAPAVYRK